MFWTAETAPSSATGNSSPSKVLERMQMSVNVQPAFDWLADYADRWVSFWEIVAGLSAAAAVVWAVAVASRERVDRVRADAERDEARRDAAEARAAESRRQREEQARLVVVWVERRMATFPNEDAERLAIIVGFSNYGPMPVHDAVLCISEDKAEFVRGISFASVLRPADGDLRGRLKHEPDKAPLNDEINVLFRDSLGVRWRRYADGSLVEHHDAEPPPVHPPRRRGRIVTGG